MEGKIKVLHIITELELGGAQLFTLYTIENLDKTKFIPFLISNRKGILNKRYGDYPNFTFVKTLVREINPLKDFLTLFSLYKNIKRIKPDIVHTHSSKAGILGRWTAFFAKTPLIIHTVHGFSFSPFHSKFKRKFYIMLEKITARITNHLIFVSYDNQREAKELKIGLNQKSSVIRSIVGLEKFKKNSNRKKELREKRGFPKDKIIVGGIFCFKPQKDPIGFLKIAKKVIEIKKEIIFYIAGDGEVRKPMEDFIKEYKLEGKIHLLGWVDNIEELLPAFDLLLLSSLWEGLPQVIVQALVSKVKVVSSNVNGVKDIIKDGINGYLFSPRDYDEAVKKILTAIENNDLAKNADKISSDILKKFNPVKMVKQQEELYLKLLKEKGV